MARNALTVGTDTFTLDFGLVPGTIVVGSDSTSILSNVTTHDTACVDQQLANSGAFRFAAQDLVLWPSIIPEPGSQVRAAMLLLALPACLAACSDSSVTMLRVLVPLQVRYACHLLASSAADSGVHH